MTTSIAMSGVYDEKPPPEVSAELSCSRNCIDRDDDWVIVKKQRVTILIPPPSPDAVNPQSHKPTISSKLSSITRCRRDWDAARKKHPDKLSAKKSQDFPAEHGGTVHEDVPMMMGEILAHSSAVPVAKPEWIKRVGYAVRESFHQGTGKVASSFGTMDNSWMPVVSSPVANKIMRARLLERQVAAFGGLRNWLFDCGLGWFVDILDSEKLGMYQLVSLTMSQLKEMGLVAVGPRRKLIHAIDSLCCPHQVEMVS
ncbi:hypothetical protein BS78_07G116300 [Paspalum vaginatum]|nr:hypothetical protein BS78_07G116300 [Paspalum vaginatum]KAJ1268170.1 hypothetical protein BS78_07G116300 [Paspalum vaginatum]